MDQDSNSTAQPANQGAMPGSTINPDGSSPPAPVEQVKPQTPATAPVPPAPPPAAVVPDMTISEMVSPKKSRKKMFAGLLAALALLIMGGSYYAFLYLPNTPENIYRRGMASIGVGLDELIETDLLQASEATEITGEFNMTQPTIASASFSGTTALSGEGDLMIDIAWDNYNPKFEFYATALGPDYPKFFFKFSGVEQIVDDTVGEGAFDQLTGGRQLENIWWLLDYEELVNEGFISQSELDELVDEAASQEQITTEDYIAVTRALIDVSNDYLFTADSDNMVLQRAENLGTEDYEGVSSEKYLVEVNEENLKSYLKAARDKIDQTGIWNKVFPDSSFKDQVSDDDIDKMVDDMNFDGVKIEAWISLDNKVLRNLRFTPLDMDDTYLDLSLLLEGTDLNRIPLRLRYVSDNDEGDGVAELNWITDVAANTAEYNFSVSVDDPNPNGTDVEMDFKMVSKGLAKAPAYEKPAPTQSFIKLLIDVSEDLQEVLGVSTEDLKF